MEPEEFVIDGDATPKPLLTTRHGHAVERAILRHDRCGRIAWRPDRVAIYGSDDALRALDAPWIEVADFYDHVRSAQHPLNAAVLDALLERPHLIPESWKIPHHREWGPHHVLFLGTVYGDQDERVHEGVVRQLHWDAPNGLWREGVWSLGRTKNFHQSAAIFVV